MSKIIRQCVQCTDKQRVNNHRLDLASLSLTYGNVDMFSEVSLPRRYTSTHTDVPPFIFTAMGHNYDKCLLNDPDVKKGQDQVVGEWIKEGNKYEIRFTVLVSTPENPNAKARNEEFCNYLSIVLESIGLLEFHLLAAHPELAATRIYVNFKSIDPAYDRVEYWHRLGHWVPAPTPKPVETEVDSSDDEDVKPVKKSHSSKPNSIRPPSQCSSCRR